MNVIPYEKMSKRKQKETRDRNRILLSRSCCPLEYRSAKDPDRQREKKAVRELCRQML